MSSYQGVPCLLLVAFNEISENPEEPMDQPLVKGYALLPREFKNDHPEVLEEFSHNHVQVLSRGQDGLAFPALVKRFILFEAELSSASPEIETEEADSSLPSMRVLVGVKERPTFYEKYIEWETGHNAMNWLKHKFGNFFDFCNFEDVCASGAVDKENLEIIETLLRHDAVSEYILHSQILHFAVERDLAALLKLLLSNGAIIDIELHVWYDALSIAVEKGFPRIVELILTYIADTRPDFYSSEELHSDLFTAIHECHIEVFRVLLEFRAKKNIPCNIPYFLEQSVRFSLPEFVEHILSLSPVLTDKVNKVTFQFAFLHREESTKFMQCYEKMEEHGFQIDYSADSLSPLLFGAIIKNWFEVVQSIVENGADVNQVFEYTEAEKYDYEEVQEDNDDARREVLRWDVFHSSLRKQLPCPSTVLAEYALCHHKKWTPLHMAAACAGEEVLELLLKHGADVNAELEGRTPIYDAIQAFNLVAIYVLIANGANVVHNPELLRFAVECGHPYTVAMLLSSRTPLNMEDSELQTLVALAAAKHSVQVIELLLLLGVQPNGEFAEECRKTSWGPTFTAGHSDTLQALLDYSFTDGDFMAACKITGFLFENPADNCPHCGENMSSCSDVVLRHAVKIKSAELRINDEKVPSYFTSGEIVDEFRKNCDTEIGRLKNERVGNSDATFYDILIGNMCQLARYAKHTDFLEAKKAEDYKNKFPIYASILKYHFKKGATRRVLLDRGFEICSRLSVKFNEFPDIVKEEIIKYLNNYELELLRYEFDQFAANADENERC